MLDEGALIVLERGDKRMIALLQRALIERRVVRVPAGVVGKSWGGGGIHATVLTNLPAPLENAAGP